MLKKRFILIVLLCSFFVMPNVSAKGWVQTDTYKYYVDDNNNILTGFQDIDGKTYFLSRDKTRYGALKTGMITINDDIFYLNPDLKKGWFEYNGNKYYANEEGKVQVGVQEIDGKTYFFSRDKTKYGANKTGMLLLGDTPYYFTPAAKTGWFEYKGNKYYANEKGEIQVGVHEVDGKVYFFSGDRTKYGANKTGMFLLGDKAYYFAPEAKTGWFEYKGNKYYANEKGEIQVGVQEVDGKTYFFSRDKTKYGANKTGMLLLGDTPYYFTPEAKTGWFEYNGNKYYANEKGEIQVGVQEVDGKTYFFSGDKTKYGTNKTGMFLLGDTAYYFAPEAKTGWFEYKGNKYYANEKGEIQVGVKEVDGKIYFFSGDRTKYGANKTGMFLLGDKAYYFAPEAKTGWFEYKGNKYYANEKGEIQTGLTLINDKKYYFSKEKSDYGQMKVGFQQIGEKRYFFSKAKEIYGQMRTGFIEIYGNKMYLNEDGSQAFGFTNIDGNTYFFSNDITKYGAMIKGWITYNNLYYNFDDNGIMQKGLQTINGRDYNFDETTGILQGFVNKDGKIYYYNPDGTQAKGVQYMADKYWKFNELNGEFEKFVRQIRVIDISSHNGNVDWETVKKSNTVDAVILRLGYGVGYIDSSFIRNKNELERLGIPYSVYLFSYAENANESLMESNFLVNTIRNHNIHIASNVLGIYYDLEDWTINSTGENSYGISKDTYGQMITTFINNTEKNLCIKTRVYASKNYIETRFPDYAKNYATWIAQWGNNITYQGPYDGWQYTSDGTIPGINGRVDQSIFYY